MPRQTMFSEPLVAATFRLPAELRDAIQRSAARCGLTVGEYLQVALPDVYDDVAQWPMMNRLERIAAEQAFDKDRDRG